MTLEYGPVRTQALLLIALAALEVAVLIALGWATASCAFVPDCQGPLRFFSIERRLGLGALISAAHFGLLALLSLRHSLLRSTGTVEGMLWVLAAFGFTATAWGEAYNLHIFDGPFLYLRDLLIWLFGAVFNDPRILKMLLLATGFLILCGALWLTVRRTHRGLPAALAALLCWSTAMLLELLSKAFAITSATMRGFEESLEVAGAAFLILLLFFLDRRTGRDFDKGIGR